MAAGRWPTFAPAALTEPIRLRISNICSSTTLPSRSEQRVAAPSLFSAAATPALNLNDGKQLEVGVKFSSSVAGSITGIKFYRAAGDTGTDVVHLWSATGALLATGTFSDTSASGWQTVTFSAPVDISAGATYVASYHTTGAFSDTLNYFTTANTNGSLTAPANAGVYAYGGNSTTGIFPTSTYLASNYFVDVAFSPSSSGTPAPSLFSAAATPALNLNDGKQLEVGVKFSSSVAGSITGIKFYRAAGDTGTDVVHLWSATGALLATGTFSDTSASGWQTVTFSAPVDITAGATYVASYHTTGAFSDTLNYFTTANTNGSLTAPANAGVYAYGGNSTTGIFPTSTYLASNYFVDVAFSPSSSGTPAPSLFSAAATPALNLNDGKQLEVGVKFSSSVAGSITGIKFYRAAGDTGTDVVHLWSATGALLATGTFSDTSASGWQTVTFSAPVDITAGATYVASYHTTGAFSDTLNYFTTANTNGSLTAPANAGVYAYGGNSTTGIFPTSTYLASNYFVDVAFSPSSSGIAGPPVAADDFYATANKTALAGSVLANDSDADGNPLSTVLVSGPSGGSVTLAANGSFIYTPSKKFSGIDSFTYKVTDGMGDSGHATAWINVGQSGDATPPVHNTPPQATGDSYATALGKNSDRRLREPTRQ